jgi:hypothetical protein
MPPPGYQFDGYFGLLGSSLRASQSIQTLTPFRAVRARDYVRPLLPGEHSAASSRTSSYFENVLRTASVTVG